MLESSLERKCGDLVRLHGGIFWKLEGTRGMPDRLILLPGKPAFFAEFKKEGKSLTTFQIHVRENLLRMGFKHYEVDNIELFRNILNDNRI